MRATACGWFTDGFSIRMAEAVMIYATSEERLVISTHDDAGAYINVPLTQLEPVSAVLDDIGAAFWVDEEALSSDGRPEFVFVNSDRRVDAKSIQQSLDGRA